MDNVIMKFLVVAVDGEAVLKYPVNAGNPNNIEMIQAVLASNPTLRLVDQADIGGKWDGSGYPAPA